MSAVPGSASLRRLAALLALCCLACLAGLAAPARAAVLELDGQGRHDLLRHLEYLEDADGRLAFQDVLQPAQQQRFAAVPTGGSAANFGLTRGAIWLRVQLRSPAGADPHWLLELAYPPLDRMELFVPDGQGWSHQLAGDQLPFASRTIAHRHHVLPLQLPAGRTTTIYLRLASEGAVVAPLRLWRPAALWQHDQAAYAVASLYFGLLLGLLLYNLLLFATVRDPAYLVYVLFVLTLGTAQAALTGLGYQYLWPQATWWNGVAPPVGMGLAAVFALLFARSFLASRRNFPRLDRVLLGLALGWLLAVVASLALPYTVASSLGSVLGMVTAGALLACGLPALQRGQGGARQYLAAWGLLLVGMLTFGLHNIGLLPANLLTSNALLLGSGLGMLLLSFALADRINVARRFRERAEARLAAEQAMVQALSESQRRLQTVLQERETILENSIVGIVFLTADGRLRWANKAMVDMFGAGSQPVTSMEPFYLSREQYLQVGAEVAAAVARGEVYQRELPVQRMDGRRLWILLSGKAVSRDDLSQGTVWVIMDISRRKELEEQLQRTMSEREAILNNAVVGIVLSVRRRHEWVNEKFASMLGYPREALIGRRSDYIHPDHAAWERFGSEARAALAATNSYNCELQLRRRDGELFWVQMGGSCLRANDPDGGVIWTFLDITERKRSEAEMRETLEQQRALNELRSRFVAMTSHEFRTPLAAILSAEELLRHYGDRLPEAERMETLDSIAAGVQRMSRMLDRVLLLGRADAKLLECRPQPLDLRALCRELVDEARLQQPQARCDITVSLAPQAGDGHFDEKLLRHILGNLLSNALKYSPQGGTVRLEVQREGEGRHEAVVFRLSDQGIGIAPEELPHLFESFHRGTNVGAIPGTGLGLAIVRSAVHAHGGTVGVASRPGEGTTFTVRIPQPREDSSAPT